MKGGFVTGSPLHHILSKFEIAGSDYKSVNLQDYSIPDLLLAFIHSFTWGSGFAHTKSPLQQPPIHCTF